MKVALVYDRVNKFGGAERVLLALHKIWPQAPLYTAVYDPQGAPWANSFKIVPSFLNKIPLVRRYHEAFPWLMPFAFESFDFSSFDVVISITSAEAKGIITQPHTYHICYCLTPTRYLWSSYPHYIANPRYGLLNPLARIFMRPMLNKLKKWDKIASKRPDYYIAISKTVRKRISKYYNRSSILIYPPSNSIFKPLDNNELRNENFFLVVSRLVSYKRIDIIIKAFNQLGLPLKIIGDGSERKILEKKAKSNIEFLGQRLTDKQLLRYYQSCLALVFAGKEDLGLAAVEVQACGKPVIACKMGGVSETVVEGKTGVLFYPQTTAALVKAIKSFKPGRFRAEDCINNANRFNEKEFIKNFKSEVEDKWQQHLKKIPR